MALPFPPFGSPGRDSPKVRTLVLTLVTLCVGAAGGFAFYALSAPAAFLTGSTALVTLWVVFKLPTHIPDVMRNGTFSVLGMMIGAGITPEGLTHLSALPVAIVGLFAVIAGATLASYWVLRHVGGWDRLSSLCGSIPGNFSLVVAVSLDQGARMERVVMSQVTRLIILVTAVPFALGGADAAGLRSTAPPDYTLIDVTVTLGLAFASAYAAKAIRLPAPTMLGPLLTSTVLSGSGLLTIAVPAWLAAIAFTVLGSSVAVRFSTVTRQGLKRMVAASLLAFLAAFAVAMTISFVISLIIEAPLGAVFLGYAPGGLDAMIALTFLLGFDVAFVALLHATRMIALAVAVPFVIALFADKVRDADERDTLDAATPR
ncbi:AbrB family transcriptional regulator [Acuticoccus sp. M5D2P5]|uniref:AbrB family transcriptional regulator n=1 Tax=Acuticoccus kalidii TaxID=2910977 RepID=UPI001F269F51|nr:AbrB family transcriptional regulator [Acuticoccus kalidii]MCF3935816.1 AbrB family transcriptional regulator [Acuticoccus kalidii]